MHIWERRDGVQPDGKIVRDRLKARKGRPFKESHDGDQSVTLKEARKDPGRYFPQWFTPDRAPRCVSASQREVEAFRQRLKGLHPSLDLSWHPIREKWQIWIRNPDITQPWCAGWHRLIFCDPDQLDDITIAALFKSYPHLFGKAETTYREFMEKRRKAEERFEKQQDQYIQDRVRDIIWKGKIRNIGDGSRFSEMYD